MPNLLDIISQLFEHFHPHGGRLGIVEGDPAAKDAALDAERLKVIREVEKLILESSHQVPLLWWHRIVATHKSLMGWEMSPSHNLGQDLARVWIDQ